MKIKFIALSISDFPLLLKWLETPHIKQWWDQNIIHTEESVKEKYSSYVEGYKLENGEKKPISSYIICIDDKPIGYIQIYNAYDFDHITGLPESLGKIDFYIGEEEYLRRGIGAKILNAFDYQSFDYILVDPDLGNITAIKTYEKAGFKKFQESLNTNEIWMIKENLKISSTKNALSYKWKDIKVQKLMKKI